MIIAYKARTNRLASAPLSVFFVRERYRVIAAARLMSRLPRDSSLLGHAARYNRAPPYRRTSSTLAQISMNNYRPRDRLFRGALPPSRRYIPLSLNSTKNANLAKSAASLRYLRERHANVRITEGD